MWSSLWRLSKVDLSSALSWWKLSFRRIYVEACCLSPTEGIIISWFWKHSKIFPSSNVRTNLASIYVPPLPRWYGAVQIVSLLLSQVISSWQRAQAISLICSPYSSSHSNWLSTMLQAPLFPRKTDSKSYLLWELVYWFSISSITFLAAPNLEGFSVPSVSFS